MTPFRRKVIETGLALFAASRIHRLLAPLTRGRGAILTFHHVRTRETGAFAPNRLLEITPDYLDRLLTHVTSSGTRIVALDAVPQLLGELSSKPFVALTFDDGYRDNLVEALPVLERHMAPFTLFATTGFLDRQAALWWLDLETAVADLQQTEVGTGRSRRVFATRTAAQKTRAFNAITRLLDGHSDEQRLSAVAKLSAAARIDSRAAVEALCLSWSELQVLAAHPLATVGCHTVTHPRLAKLSRLEVLRELGHSRDVLETAIGKPVRHLAYPYGDASSAGAREFDMARELGFATAVTTRPGVLFAQHLDHLTALPRISMNGLWQDTSAAEVLLSGAPLAMWNRGRRLNVAS